MEHMTSFDDVTMTSCLQKLQQNNSNELFVKRISLNSVLIQDTVE